MMMPPSSDDAISRRELLTRATIAAAAGIMPRSLRAAPQQRATAFDWKTVAPNARVAFGTGGNALVVSRGHEALLVDTKVHAFGRVLRREAEAFGARITHVVNTHHHSDHTGGNDGFAGSAEIVAHANVRQRVMADVQASLSRLKGAPVDAYANGLRQSGFDVRITPEASGDVEAFIKAIDSVRPESFAPTTTLTTERELRAAGYAVHLRHASPGHTDNDVIVHVPELNLIHAGDLLFNEHNPFIDVRAGATTTGWDRCLVTAIALCNASTIVVAGHGPTTDRAGLQRQRDYFNRLRDVVRGAMREGRTRAEIVALKPAGFAQFTWPELLTENLGVLYDELAKG
jgi:cyclase